MKGGGGVCAVFECLSSKIILYGNKIKIWGFSLCVCRRCTWANTLKDKVKFEECIKKNLTDFWVSPCLFPPFVRPSSCLLGILHKNRWWLILWNGHFYINISSMCMNLFVGRWSHKKLYTTCFFSKLEPSRKKKEKKKKKNKRLNKTHRYTIAQAP
jgi:hypothetical protein